jgi:hypothetical protein
MRRLALPTLVGALALAAPAVAQAKGPITVNVCGAQACASVETPAHMNPFDGDARAVRAAPPSPYYRLVLESGDERWTIFYVPSAGALALPYRDWLNWQELSGAAATDVRRLARRLQPLPPPTVSRARAGDRLLPGDPSSYLGLLAARPRIALPGNARPLPIELSSKTASPWTNVVFLYYPDRRLMQRGISDFVRVSPAVAARLEGTRPPAVGGGADAFPWRAVTLVAAVLLVLGAAAVTRRRIAVRPT